MPLDGDHVAVLGLVPMFSLEEKDEEGKSEEGLASTPDSSTISGCAKSAPRMDDTIKVEEETECNEDGGGGNEFEMSMFNDMTGGSNNGGGTAAVGVLETKI
eukprot:3705862-Ditylum_brightwellii.AAC.1